MGPQEVLHSLDPLNEGSEGPAAWEGKGLVSIFWVIRGPMAIVSLSVRSWILYRRPHNCLCRALGIHIRSASSILFRWGACHRFRLRSGSEVGILKLLIH